MPKYRYVGTVAREAELGDKRPMLEPGEFVTMSAEQYKTNDENGLKFIEVKNEGSDK